MEILCYGCGRGENPENTIEAIRHCLQINADWHIEMDLQITKDGEIILFHDTHTERITGVKNAVHKRTLQEIEQLNAAYNFAVNNTFPYRDHPLKIPTLKEVCSLFPTAKLILDVHTDNLRSVDKIITIIEQGNLTHPPIIVSQYDTIIVAFKEAKPQWQYGAATRELKKMVFSSFLYLDTFFPIRSDILLVPVKYGNLTLLTKRVIKHCKKRNKKIWAWLQEGNKNQTNKEVITINSVQQLIPLLQKKVDGAFTETPEKLYREIAKNTVFLE